MVSRRFTSTIQLLAEIMSYEARKKPSFSICRVLLVLTRCGKQCSEDKILMADYALFSTKSAVFNLTWSLFLGCSEKVELASN